MSNNARATLLPTSASTIAVPVRQRTKGGGAKSRSPGPSRRNPLAPTDPFTPSFSHQPAHKGQTLKRKKSANSLHVSIVPTSGNNELVDRGQKLRLGSVAEVVPLATTTRSTTSSNKKEKPRPPASSRVEEGPSAAESAAEIERLNKEVEILRQALQESKKQSKKHSKHLQEMKVETSAWKLTQKDQEAQITTLQSQNRASEDFIAGVESSLQCQICMELLMKPHALSPCGHVLCQGCLQEWFRKAPPSADDMDIDPAELQNDPHYLMHREKTCPCCRAIVVRKPVPVFLVKSVVSALSKYKAKGARAITPPTDPEDEPWKGLFVDTDDEDYEDGVDGFSDYTGDEEDEDEEEGQVAGFAGLYGGLNFMYPGFLPHPYIVAPEDYSTDGEMDEDQSDGEDGMEDEEEEELVAAHWQPPIIPWDEIPRNCPRNTRSFLRRGCVDAMIHIFGMEYTRANGLVAYVTSLDRVNWEPAFMNAPPSREGRRTAYRLFLGWNVDLEEWDHDGRGYVGAYLDDLDRSPERYIVEARGRRMLSDVRQLVSAADMDEDYDTMDSDDYD